MAAPSQVLAPRSTGRFRPPRFGLGGSHLGDQELTGGRERDGRRDRGRDGGRGVPGRHPVLRHVTGVRRVRATTRYGVEAAATW